jgi:unsaturated rhamnogalacturonyl hydrolase
MFTYAYLKGVRIGVLPNKYLSVGKKAYNGLIEQFITKNNDGTINLTSTCRSAGLGPAKDPSRDGTADYYLCGSDIKKVSNEGKAIGPFIMASLEYEKVK